MIKEMDFALRSRIRKKVGILYGVGLV